MMTELSVAEQRYRAVLEVGAGVPVTKVAERFADMSQARADARDLGPFPRSPRTVDVATCAPSHGLYGLSIVIGRLGM
jgi:hypothetical protein